MNAQPLSNSVELLERRNVSEPDRPATICHKNSLRTESDDLIVSEVLVEQMGHLLEIRPGIGVIQDEKDLLPARALGGSLGLLSRGSGGRRRDRALSTRHSRRS